MSRRAYIGLGSNLGDRLGNLAAALRELDALDGVEVVSVSHAYESEPWGVEEQPPFANAVAELSVSLTSDELLDTLLELEDVLGRERVERYGPRVIDLDLLLFDGQERATPRLTLPHPRLREREFVVRPLLEIAPDGRLPDGGALDPAAAIEGRVVRVLGVLEGFETRTPR